MRQIDRKLFLKSVVSSAILLKSGGEILSPIGGKPDLSSGKVQGHEASGHAAELLARMTVRPSPARRARIESLITSLHNAGVWGRLDGLYVFAAHDIQAARLNWVGCMRDITSVNAPVFQIDRGFSGDGAAAFLDTNTAFASLDRLQQHDGTVGIRLSPRQGDKEGPDNDHYSSRLYKLANNESPSTHVAESHCTSSLAGRMKYGAGLFGWSRSAQSVQMYFDGEPIYSSTHIDGFPTKGPITILKVGDRYISHEVSAAFFGAGLSRIQHAAVNSALNRYLGSLGT